MRSSNVLMALVFASLSSGCGSVSDDVWTRKPGFQPSSNKSTESKDPAVFSYNSDDTVARTIIAGNNPVRSVAKSATGDKRLHQVSLNEVPIKTAARLILHDKLKLPVQIDADVNGTITLEARNGITSNHLLQLFGLALRHSGANLTVSGNLAVISRGEVFPLPRNNNGSGISVLHLDYISSNDFVDLISGMIGQSVQVRSDPPSNSIIVSGPSLRVEGVLDLARQMDSEDWRLASYALIPVDRDTGPTTASLMREVFAGSTTPTINVGYIGSLSALWVVGASDLSIDRAKLVATQFETFAERSKPQRFVWPLKSAKAAATREILHQFISEETESDDENILTRSVDAVSGAGGNVQFGDLTESQPRFDESPPVIVADAETNSLVFEVTQKDWSRLLPMLLQLDRPITQVHISVTILEVLLTDSLSYGIQHALSFGAFDWIVATTLPPLNISRRPIVL